MRSEHLSGYHAAKGCNVDSNAEYVKHDSGIKNNLDLTIKSFKQILYNGKVQGFVQL